MGFKAEPKMKSTEMSADEVSAKGMKSGGKTKKMAMGGGMGALPAAAAPAMGRAAPAMGARPPMGRAMPARPPMGARKPDPRQAMIEAAMAQKAAQAQAPMMRKKGGKAEGGESKAEMKADKAQDKAMIGKAFKQHDAQEHKGGKGTKLKLQTGGVANAQGGYKKGGIAKYATGGVVNGAAGYKEGGFAKVSCKDGGGFKAMKKGNC
jgi:hypothetical protein